MYANNSIKKPKNQKQQLHFFYEWKIHITIPLFLLEEALNHKTKLYKIQILNFVYKTIFNMNDSAIKNEINQVSENCCYYQSKVFLST